MQEFYIFGLKSRDEFRKSPSSYDNAKQRINSWLKDYMQFQKTDEGKVVCLSIDTRISSHNPLYKVWKTKTFTERQITLHFLIMDILYSPEESLSNNAIIEKIGASLINSGLGEIFIDDSYRLKVLKKYVDEGLVIMEKRGNTNYYHRAENFSLPTPDVVDAIHFFSEIFSCGVIGSYILDKIPEHEDHLAFKHHYITSTMDSEIIYQLLTAIKEQKELTLTLIDHLDNHLETTENVIPLKLMVSVQSGRQYLMAYSLFTNKIISYRSDNIASIKEKEKCPYFDELQDKFAQMLPHIWGVSPYSWAGNSMEHVEFTIHYSDSEQYIPKRLEREKRCGTIEYLDSNTCRFSADVYDSRELLPWIRTFICRITDLKISNPEFQDRFVNDLNTMYAMYGLEDNDSCQK